jgi:hypothetical protein
LAGETEVRNADGKIDQETNVVYDVSHVYFEDIISYSTKTELRGNCIRE